MQLAFGLASEALGATRELERRVDILEDAARPSRIDPEFEARVIAALERRSSSTRPPQDSMEIKTPGGTRVRGNLPLVIVVSLVVLLTAAILRAEQLRDLIKALR